MKTMTLHRLITLISIVGISAMMAFAETVTKGRVTIKYENMPDGSIKVTDVWNSLDKFILLTIDGKNKQINANSSAKVNQHARSYVRYDFAQSSGETLWRPSPKKEPVAKESLPVKTEPTEDNVIKETKNDARPTVAITDPSPITSPAGASFGYFDKLNQDEFFGKDAVEAYIQKIETFCKSINASNNKSQFIIDNDVEQFLEQSEQEINDKKSNLATIAQEIVSAADLDEANQESAMTLIVETLNNRLKTREDAYEKLNTIVSDVNSSNSITENSQGKRIAKYIIVIVVIILIIVLTIIVLRRIKNRQNKVSKSISQSSPSHDASSDNPMIVVRRKTSSILKKQCIDDVIDNPAYLEINTSDFTSDSAVRTIYIRNSCIKDVYNLYAEDLRNTENPKEDGCMVLGRWVRDEETNTYDISLEDVVLPGDDAVFKEYELNFGGKIKLRIAERLRKLRRDTNLQYDLVCWIHSHPGLGVFFSNSDDNVQMQLKHSQHPNFLIAFVVDILTSDQELGIFTFRKDGSMNSKGDITKMYSLEEMYKWALQSERSSFSHDNYFNIVDNAHFKLPACKGVELNNNSIIDLSQIVIESETGIVGWAIGTTVENNGNQEYVVSTIIRNSAKPGTGVIGCLISMTHMSFPTIQRLIAGDSVNLSFVMVYSSKQKTLTTIPVINGELLSNEQFYGDVNIDDLKIWTRRKR